YQGVDVWVEAHFTKFEDDTAGGARDGHLGVLYVGIDRLVNSAVLVGFLGQFDWSEEQSSVLNYNVDGRGWMAGPYVSTRLTPNLFFDARGAWGQSQNNINPFGTYVDEFDTNRWLVTARLTGNWRSGNYRITPSVSVKYMEERQKSYTDSLGVAIPAQTVSLGRVTFGPEFARRFVTASETVIELQTSINGIWDFDGAPQPISSLAAISSDRLRARLEGGFMISRPSGAALRLTGTYDGLGASGFHSYGVQCWFNVPLN
ncbi:MAG: autotransporter outer membrane beta-barrel domain-containing protein, partial [Fimbriimonadaceae bacterium]|nr:autotransporter outer membrane beta-barrel domain-containing protein [Alphaproteobacteria bacterium]